MLRNFPAYLDRRISTRRTASYGEGNCHKDRWRLLSGWMAQSRQRQALAELDARLLDDVGISEACARREAGKWFWQR